MKIKFADFIIFGIFLAAIIVFFLLVIKPMNQNKKTLLINNGKDKWVYQLDQDRKIEIPGKLGKSTIEIKDGKAFFLDSPCDNKICVFSKALEKNGDWAACLPNGIFITIQGQEEDQEFDALAQ